MGSGLRPANAQLKDRKRRWGLRLLSLPGATSTGTRWSDSTLRKSLESFLGYSRRTEETVLRETATDLDAATITTDAEYAKRAAEGYTPGFTVYTDGSRTEEGRRRILSRLAKRQSWMDSRSTWATTRKPTTQSVWPLQRRKFISLPPLPPQTADLPLYLPLPLSPSAKCA